VARVAVSPSGEALLMETRTRRDAFLAARLQDFSPEDRTLLARAIPLLERLASDDS
jgi:hypothetical protein